MRYRMTTILIVAFFVALPAVAQNSKRGTAEATINGKKVSINYGRPSLKGRDVLSMAKAGMVWRLGMDEATEIEFTGNLIIAGKELKAGKYSLWAKKTGENQWILGFHPKTGIWGIPEMTSGYVAELPLKVDKVPQSSEQLTIGLSNNGGNAAINIHWGTSQLTGSFGVK